LMHSKSEKVPKRVLSKRFWFFNWRCQFTVHDFNINGSYCYCYPLIKLSFPYQRILLTIFPLTST
jgi:hypothetical protein